MRTTGRMDRCPLCGQSLLCLRYDHIEQCMIRHGGLPLPPLRHRVERIQQEHAETPEDPYPDGG